MIKGELVKQLMEDQGLTREKLAQKAGIAESTLWRITHGGGRVKIKTLKKVAKALGVRIEDTYIQNELKEMSAEEKICKAYDCKGMTLREISEETGVSGETITNLKKDIFSVQRSCFCKVVVFLGLDPEKLYNDGLDRRKNMTLDDKIKVLCRRKGITQEQFATLLGIEKGTILYMLTKKRTKIGIRTYRQWAKILEVSPEFFCSEETMIQEALSQNTVGGRLGKLCEMEGISLKELSRLSGISYSTISNIKREINITPKEITLIKLAEALDVSFTDLMNGI